MMTVIIGSVLGPFRVLAKTPTTTATPHSSLNDTNRYESQDGQYERVLNAALDGHPTAAIKGRKKLNQLQLYSMIIHSEP